METRNQVGDSNGKIEIYTDVMIFKWDFLKSQKTMYDC